MNNLTPKQKAKELVEKFKDYVHGYIGSSMLTNHEYPEQILSQAKKVALITVDEIINTDCLIDEDAYVETPSYLQYWQFVKKEIEAL
jgi:hypothetical protein